MTQYRGTSQASCSHERAAHCSTWPHGRNALKRCCSARWRCMACMPTGLPRPWLWPDCLPGSSHGHGHDACGYTPVAYRHCTSLDKICLSLSLSLSKSLSPILSLSFRLSLSLSLSLSLCLCLSLSLSLSFSLSLSLIWHLLKSTCRLVSWYAR